MYLATELISLNNEQNVVSVRTNLQPPINNRPHPDATVQHKTQGTEIKNK